MTTVAQLKKYGEELGFTEQMASLGFKLGPNKFWFYRERGDFIDYLDFWIKSSGCFLTIPVMCLKKDLVTHCDLEHFPKRFDKDIPFYSSTFVNEEYGVEIGSDPWKVESKKDIENTFSEAIELIRSSAEAWWKGIVDNQSFYDSFTINFQESVEADRLKKLLLE